MPKKFFDIIPPKEIKLSPEKIKLKKEKKAPSLSIKEEKPKRFFLKGIIFCSVFLILIGILCFLFFSKIEIEIWPETDILNLKEIVIIDLSAENPNFEAKIIPGKIFQDQKFSTEEFTSSGKVLKEEKARGTIRVYNASSTSPRTLIPSRFISADGKLFWSTETVVIPGGKYEKGKLVPGFADVKVEAAQAGQDYNIEPSTFALPALAGSPSYTTIYGKSFSPMTGGFRGEVPQILQEDLDRAENALAGRLKTESRESLKMALPTDFVLLDGAIAQEITEIKASLEAGAEAESFNLQVKVESGGLGFKKSDLENFAKNVISLGIPEDKKIHEESLEISYFPEAVDMESGKMTLNLEIRTKIYSDIDLLELKKALSEKSFEEVKIFLENLNQVTKIEIKSWPFWRKKVPENTEKIEIKLNLD